MATDEIYFEYWLRLDKKNAGKPMPVQILNRRTMNTATSILIAIKDVEFKDLSASLYFFCQDLKIGQFTRLYESQVELAAANPEKFAFGLYAFYNDISIKIKKENLYSEFFEFMHVCVKYRTSTKLSKAAAIVIECYLSLLMQNMEFIKDKFNYTQIVCGRKTTGELILINDAFPMLDMPGYEMQTIFSSMKAGADVSNLITQSYAKYGYKVNSMDDAETLNYQDRIFTNNVLTMMSFINEYTYDIVPVTPFSAKVTQFLGLDSAWDSSEISSLLAKRKRTVPTNGQIIRFTDNSFFKEILFKEMFFNNSIFMLYKLQTKEGDLSGFYDTKCGYLYCLLLDYDDESLQENFRAFILYLYGTIVLSNPKITIDNLPIGFSHYSIPITAKSYGCGGKLKNVYDNKDPEAAPDASRRADDRYSSEIKSIQGYIRKLPVGQNPSSAAVELAESLGYDLAPDETYVQSFFKHVLKLKETIELI